MPTSPSYINMTAYTEPENPSMRRRNDWIASHPNHFFARWNSYTLRVARINEAEAGQAWYGGDNPRWSGLVVGNEGSLNEQLYHEGVIFGDFRTTLNYIEVLIHSRNGEGDVLYGLSSIPPNHATPVWEWYGEIGMNFAGSNIIAVSAYVPQVYCGQCDTRLPESETVRCDVCRLNRCLSCQANHDHNGEFCTNCNYAMSASEDAGYCDSEGVYFCSRHEFAHEYCGEEPEYEEDYDRRRPRIQGYGQEATLSYIDRDYIEHPILRMKRAATVELEAEFVGTNTDQLVKFMSGVGVGGDGSLYNGIEVTLPPSRGAVLAEFMENSCKAMKDAGFVAKESCGMHAHIDMRDKVNDKKFLAHLFNALFAFEDILFAMQENDRHLGEYSIPLRNGYKFYEMYGQEVESFDFNFYKQQKTPQGKRWLDSEKSRKYASPRYASFNFHSMYFRGSLECRIHEGTLDAEDALRWIDLLQRIIARVERGHSYEFMRRMVKTPVTIEKVRAFNRYFKIPRDLRIWMHDRINRGQGYNFDLGQFKWGAPKRGRSPKMEQDIPYLNQNVACGYCAHQFRMRRTLDRCPNCSRRLFDWSTNEALYQAVAPTVNWASLGSAFESTSMQFQDFSDNANNIFAYDEPLSIDESY